MLGLFFDDGIFEERSGGHGQRIERQVCPKFMDVRGHMLAIQPPQRAVEIADCDLTPVADANDVGKRLFHVGKHGRRARFTGLRMQIVFELGEHVGIVGREEVPIAAQTNVQAVGGRVLQQHACDRIFDAGQANRE